MVPGFRHLPGNHCGSTALRNLLAHHGAEISEEMALGLGAGVSFYYLNLDGQSPSRFTNGRVRSLEKQFVELTGTPISLETFDRAEASWDAARRVVDDGRAAILLTDIYYLDHYGSSARFPGHAVVLAGYDDEVAYLSDTSFAELQVTPIETLGRARHGDHPAFALEGHMFTASGRLDAAELRSAAGRAMSQNARQMIDPPLGEYEGLPALRRFAAEVGEWPSAVEDWRWCARFGYQVIERRGTGGGNFRLMYSRFLDEVGSENADLAAEAASGWTALAAALQDASEPELPDAGRWALVGKRAEDVLAAEERLWPALAS
jgi:Butirosin biosynthesis protein H, N-terminal/Domain of unknown function (DUF4872)